MHKLLVNRLFKPAQEKVWLGAMTIAVDLGRKAAKQTNKTKSTTSDFIFDTDSYADPESFVRGGPTLLMLFFYLFIF